VSRLDGIDIEQLEEIGDHATAGAPITTAPPASEPR